MNKGPQMTNEQWDILYGEMIDYFSKNSLFELVEKSLDLIFDPTTNRMQLINS